MATTTTTTGQQISTDLRCLICKQKHVFHCEHDTPYRDQYLGVYDPKSPMNFDVQDPSPRNAKVAASKPNEKAKNTQGRTSQLAGQNKNANGRPKQGQKEPAKKGCTIL